MLAARDPLPQIVRMGAIASGAERRPVQSFDPTADRVWRTFEPASAEAVLAAVAAARRAQRAWRDERIGRRADLVRRVRRQVFEDRTVLIDLLRRETGKTEFEALMEVLLTADTAAWAARETPRLLRTRRTRSWRLATARKSVELRWEPFGVVGLIWPWNYPLLLGSGVLFPAVVAGNAVVLKPSELAPSCGAALAELFHRAGAPPGLVQCVQGDGTVGAALIEAGIDRLFFTGSEATGRKIARACGERLIPCSLELGGSDAAIVLADADLAVAAEGIVWGRCTNAGQTCVAPKRVFVERSVHDRFVREAARVIGCLRVGAGEERDVGPVIRGRQADRLREQRADALAGGARVLAGAAPSTPSRVGAVPVELLGDVHDGMRVMREETFGPLLPVVPVDSADEAVERANASTYGLSASIWTRDVRHGRALARRIEAGTVMINDVIMEAGMPEVAHGGVKASGTGRLHGALGIAEVAWPKTIVVDPFARWRQVWWYPYTARLRDGMAAFFHLMHGRGALGRVRSGIRAVRLLYFGRRGPP